MSTLNIEVIWNGILKVYETVNNVHIYIYIYVYVPGILKIYYGILNGILNSVLEGILKVH